MTASLLVPPADWSGARGLVPAPAQGPLADSASRGGGGGGGTITLQLTSVGVQLTAVGPQLTALPAGDLTPQSAPHQSYG